MAPTQETSSQITSTMPMITPIKILPIGFLADCSSVR
jgi:hypothetical protein